MHDLALMESVAELALAAARPALSLNHELASDRNENALVLDLHDRRGNQRSEIQGRKAQACRVDSLAACSDSRRSSARISSDMPIRARAMP